MGYAVLRVQYIESDYMRHSCQSWPYALFLDDDDVKLTY